MALAVSKLSAQGQISVPAEVRKLLGVGPGEMIEWEVDGEQVVVRRKAQYSFEDMHQALHPDGPPRPAKTLDELNEAKAMYVREQHARGRY